MNTASKPPRPIGLRRSRKSPSINWQLDADYLDELSPEEQEYLGRFLDEYYFSAPKGRLHSPDQLRERWAAYKQNQRDIMSRGDIGGTRAGVDVDAPDWYDGKDAPAEIKSATEEYRRLSELRTSDSSVEDDLIAQIDARAARKRAAEGRPLPSRAADWAPFDEE